MLPHPCYDCHIAFGAADKVLIVALAVL